MEKRSIAITTVPGNREASRAILSAILDGLLDDYRIPVIADHMGSAVRG